MWSTHIGFIAYQRFLKVSFIVFTAFVTYFHDRDLERTENYVGSKEDLILI